MCVFERGLSGGRRTTPRSQFPLSPLHGCLGSNSGHQGAFTLGAISLALTNCFPVSKMGGFQFWRVMNKSAPVFKHSVRHSWNPYLYVPSVIIFAAPKFRSFSCLDVGCPELGLTPNMDATVCWLTEACASIHLVDECITGVDTQVLQYPCICTRRTLIPTSCFHPKTMQNGIGISVH